MKQFVIATLMLAGAASANAAVDAAKAQELANKNACMGCHQVDKKLVGPAYKDVAAKYKGDKNAMAALSKKVKGGGAGVWGPVPMPANPNLSDADVKILVEWVLAGAPAK
ncbi:c-type cytochrome [Cupriavidus respiraculi]|uniref:c-type cytochrome n=1 Tax=Cupriavidus respiraculi TaxID=195930 RepID=UPI001C952FA7|nr:c-type cytochrome [Cupriavidus respiraculi]MBY4946592.1 c-type cytochrome [Cupriavidus respiraculi]